MKCSICGKEFEGYGNDPWPIRLSIKARCCDECNMKYVIRARLGLKDASDKFVQQLAEILDDKNSKQLDVLLGYID